MGKFYNNTANMNTEKNTLKKTIITFKEPESRLSYNVSSAMQGVLMENVSYGFGERMHENGSKPYSQHLVYKNSLPVWTINTLSGEAERELADPLMKPECTQIYLRNKDMFLEIAGKSQSEIEFDELLQSTFFAECSRYIKIRFRTPTAFKTNGRYQFYPTVRHIIKSLAGKFNACGFEAEIDLTDDIESMEENIDIADYSLRSTFFYLEGVRIPSFTGWVMLRIRGPQQLANLMHLLVRFGEYSGVGIKTAMGMGAIEIEERKEPVKHEKAKA